MSAALGHAKKKAETATEEKKERSDDGERVARADGKKKKGRDADLNDDVMALFEQARTDLALDDEERDASRRYRAA